MKYLKPYINESNYNKKIIVFKVSNISENNICQHLLFDNGYTWYEEDVNIVRDFDEYPVYLFAESDMSIGYMDKQDLSTLSIKTYINNCIINGEQIWPTIFNFSDVKYIDKINKHGYIQPVYVGRGKPLRENNTWYPYRFKTEQEFIDEYGEDWENLTSRQYTNWCEEMNAFFGMIFPFKSNELKSDSNNVLGRRWEQNGVDWMIAWYMLTPNDKIPNYIPKGKQKRVLESNTWYPYRFKTEQEFIDEYGVNWRNYSCYTFTLNMDYLFGQIYPYFINYNSIGERELPYMKCDTSLMSRGYWLISKYMLTPNDEVPNYIGKGKQKRILESTNKYPYKNIIIEIHNEKELNIFNSFFQLRYDLIDIILKVYFNENIPVFILLNYSPITNNISYNGYSKLVDLPRLVISMQLDYEKLFNINDVKNNLLKQITEKGKYICHPTYVGKGKQKRILESTNKYPYKNIIIEIHNENELNIFNRFFQLRYDLIDIILNHYFNKNIPVFIKLIYSPLTKNISYDGYSELVDLPRLTISMRYDYEKLFNINDVKNNLLKQITEKGKYIDHPTYVGKGKQKRILESTNKYPYKNIIIEIHNEKELNIFNRFFQLRSNLIDTILNHYFNKNIPVFIKLNYSPITKNISYDGYSKLVDLPCLTISMRYDYEKLFNINDVKNNLLKQITENGKYIDHPTYVGKGKQKRILESINNDVLHIFDFDDTLVYSERFEEKVKHLIKENITSGDILNTEVNKLGISISQLKYENGRIYINDINHEINIPNDSSWVRKKDRIYLIQPESYYTIDESIPIGIYDKIVELYNSVDNKMILTARKEKLRDKVLFIINKFKIDIPNYGLYMYPNKTNMFSSKWKSEKIIEVSNNFNEIHYYDDNVKQLKRIYKYLQDKNINIYFHIVMKNTYKDYNN